MKNNKVTCEEMALKVMALIDNELDDDQIHQVEDHLKICKKCSADFSYRSIIQIQSVFRIK